MAAAHSLLAIDLGAHTVKAALFRPHGKGGLATDGVFVAPIADHGTDDAINVATTSALRQLLARADIRGAKVSYSIAGHVAFTRFVKIVMAGPEAVAQMVRYEAQQNVPFPLSEVVWDYQLIQGTDPTDLQAVLVAVKADVLERLHQAVAAGVGTVPTRVDIAPLALYNAFRFNYPDHDGCSLLIDVGAKTTQLLFIDGRRLWLRSVPIAGNQITSTIAGDLSESNDAAQTTKHERGFVGLGGAYEDPEDEIAARVSKVIRTRMTQLHQEISRSIVTYRNQQGGANPQRVILCGGSSQLAYMNLFFEEKLRMPCEFFNPLRNVAVGPNADQEALRLNAHIMGELVGQALRHIGPCPAEFDLVPHSVKVADSSSRRRSLALAAGVAWAALLGSTSLYATQTAAVLQTQHDQLAAAHAKLEKTSKDLARAKHSLDYDVKRAAQLETFVGQREAWKSVLRELNSAIPTGVWITKLTPLAGGRPLNQPVVPPSADLATKKTSKDSTPSPTQITEIAITGLYEAYPKELLRDPQVFREGADEIQAQLKKLGESTVFEKVVDYSIKTKTAGQVELALGFDIRLLLKEPISLLP